MEMYCIFNFRFSLIILANQVNYVKMRNVALASSRNNIFTFCIFSYILDTVYFILSNKCFLLFYV